MPSTHEWMLMVVAALAATGGQLFMTYGFARLSVAAGSLIQMLVPVIVAAGGMVWFGEALRPGEWLGAGLVLAGTALPFLGARVRRGDSGVA
jgi:drug/metabolite transporter (DMT)-like permease